MYDCYKVSGMIVCEDSLEHLEFHYMYTVTNTHHVRTNFSSHSAPFHLKLSISGGIKKVLCCDIS